MIRFLSAVVSGRVLSLALMALASSAHAATLVAIERIPADATLNVSTFTVKCQCDLGPYADATLVDFAFTGPDNVQHHALYTGSPTANFVVLAQFTATIPATAPAGKYTVDYVALQSSNRQITQYNHDGTITSRNLDTGSQQASGRHGFAFNSLDFQLNTDPQPPKVGTLTTLRLVTPSPVSSLSNSLSFEYTYLPAGEETAVLEVGYQTSLGETLTVGGGRVLRTDPKSTAKTTASPSLPAPYGPDFAATYATVSANGHSVTYYRDGRLYVDGRPGLPSTHALDLATLDFAVAVTYRFPLITSLIRKPGAFVGPGDPLTLEFDYVSGTNAVSRIDFLYVDSAGGRRHIVAAGDSAKSATETMLSTWPDGSCTLQSVTVFDAGNGQIAYMRDGTVTTTGTGPTRHALNLAACDIQISHKPIIVTTPASQTVQLLQPATFTVSATNSPPFTYQWLKDGSLIAGATNTTFSLSAAQTSDAGQYSVIVTNSFGGTTSPAAKLTVIVPFTVQIAATAYAVPIGGTTLFSATTIPTEASSYQWLKDGVPISGATRSTYLLKDATVAHAGDYSCQAGNGSQTNTSPTIRLQITGPLAWFTNVSVRATMTAGGPPLMIGLTVTNGGKPILVRAAGPALAAFGLTDVQRDPRVWVIPASAGAGVFSNDDWDASLASDFAGVGAFGFTAGSKDSALLPTLEGGYTIEALATGPGAVLVEAYDTHSSTNQPRLTNLAARNVVGTGDSILIMGFAIGGSGTKRVLVRAIGPTLANYGITRPLIDPLVQVYDSKQTVVAENNDWDVSLVPTFQSVAAFPIPAGSKDSAVVATLAPGIYTVQVKGADGGTGEAVIELYELP